MASTDQGRSLRRGQGLKGTPTNTVLPYPANGRNPNNRRQFLSVIGQGTGPLKTDRKSHPINSYSSGSVLPPVPGNSVTYQMRGWQTGALVYEYWTSTTGPNTSNPSGLPITGITYEIK